MSVTFRRTARKARRCDGCNRREIRPGDTYLSHTSFPSDDMNEYGRVVRYAECAECATQHGRGPLLEGKP